MGYDLSPIIIRSIHKRLISQGFTHKEATQLLAKLMGLAAQHKDMTLKEILNLFYVEHLQDKLEEEINE